MKGFKSQDGGLGSRVEGSAMTKVHHRWYINWWSRRNPACLGVPRTLKVVPLGFGDPFEDP